MSQVCRSEKEFKTWVPLLFHREGKLFVFVTLGEQIKVEIGEGTGKQGKPKKGEKTAAVSDQVAGGRKR